MGCSASDTAKDTNKKAAPGKEDKKNEVVQGPHVNTATSGILDITVIEARLTRDTETFGKMDPYCKITTRQQEFKTAVQNGAGLTPTWNETFEIDVKYVGDDCNIEVHDEDLGSDDMVGIYTFKLSSLCVNGGLDEWFPIAYLGKQSGQVHLKGVWKPHGAGAQPAGGAQQQVMQQPGMQQ